MPDRRAIEFGDFQTPPDLADCVAGVVADRRFRPASFVEPACGTGVFVQAGLRAFRSLRQVIAIDVNDDHLVAAKEGCADFPPGPLVCWRRDDFFRLDWAAELSVLPEPVLIMGNPPWVTSAGQRLVGGRNLPAKSNFRKYRGLDARTGKANFDIAEWMLIQLLESLASKRAMLAMLVKSAVARRVLAHAWQNARAISRCAMYRFDAKRYFDVSASACLFVCECGNQKNTRECDVFDLDEPDKVVSTIAWRDSMLVADSRMFDSLQHLCSQDAHTSKHRWRSGIKHDCSRIMELRRDECGPWQNGLKELVDIEGAFVYPMLKGSDLARGELTPDHRRMIVTQRKLGEDTNRISREAARTWEYLCRHGERLDRRASSIYRNRPRFSVFGVGSYAFAPWKIAIAGLYKRLDFRIIGPHGDKPVVFDDTVYYLSFENERDARLMYRLLRTESAQRFLRSLIFFEAKRPITIDVLSRLDFDALYQEKGSALSQFDCASVIASDGLARLRRSRTTGEL